jgi:ribosomal protein S18 acetylase RimI-like enzyme
MTIEIAAHLNDEILTAFQRLLPQLNSSVPPPGPAELHAMLTSDATTLFIARDNQSNITGVLALVVFRTPTGVHAWIEDVVVDESARNLGIGKELTIAALHAAQSKGARSVDLTSRPDREAANHLYQSLGFCLRSTNLYRYDLSNLNQ